MTNHITLVLWSAVLIASAAICLLPVFRGHPHPKSILDHADQMHGMVEAMVPEFARPDARAAHKKVASHLSRAAQGRNDAANIATIVVLISIVAIVMEVKRIKQIQPRTRN